MAIQTRLFKKPPPDHLPEQFYQELDQFPNKYLLFSGGWDSTFIGLQLYRRGIECTIIWNNTHNTLKTQRNTIKKFREYTGWDFIELHPSLKDIKTAVKKSFYNLEKAITAKEEQKHSSVKNIFPCCHALKKKPFNQIYKSLTPRRKKTTCFILGLAGYEAARRQWRLAELRVQNTFIRLKENKLNYIYPLRDFTNYKKRQLIINYLNADPLFYDTQHTGCVLCPLLLVYKKRITGPNVAHRRELATRFYRKLIYSQD